MLSMRPPCPRCFAASFRSIARWRSSAGSGCGTDLLELFLLRWSRSSALRLSRGLTSPRSLARGTASISATPARSNTRGTSGARRERHRLDFGDSGPLNYAWYVGGTEKMHLQPYQTGQFGSAEVHLKHPEKELLHTPLVLSYAEKIGRAHV